MNVGTRTDCYVPISFGNGGMCFNAIENIYPNANPSFTYFLGNATRQTASSFDDIV